MKNRIFRFLSVFCSIIIAISCLSFSGVSADEPVGKMSSVYAYVLNDYLYTYGAMHTENAGDSLTDDGSGTFAPNGVIYAEIINFDANESPYLVIFLAEAQYNVASCHVWKYNDETEIAERIAVLDSNYSLLGQGETGVFSLGFSNEKRYIIFQSRKDNELVGADYYTAINGDAFEYVNEPSVLNVVDVMDFGCDYFHSGIDISKYNKTVGDFFDDSKNSAADSVTYEDIAEHLSDEDEGQIEAVLKNVTSFTDFDIANYTSMEEYKEALNIEPNGDRFYLISEVYDLDDEIYYVRFSTDRSYYNYALLRRSDDAENGYQILKVRTDCIPLSDRELKQIKSDYDKNTLLYKKAKGSLKLNKKSSNDKPAESKAPLIQIEKTVSSRTRLPAICIGGGIAIALLTILWVYLYSDSD
ncbi:MAG: hypothetical protein LIO53_05810 [Oscillospiraceae bacterium]|nr:hypothetical protein [Oscillospiraceae bacterium]